jgi:hypothetical protein
MKLERLNNKLTISNLSTKDYDIILNIIPNLLKKYGYNVELSDNYSDNKTFGFTLEYNYPDLSEFTQELVRELHSYREFKVN